MQSTPREPPLFVPGGNFAAAAARLA